MFVFNVLALCLLEAFGGPGKYWVLANCLYNEGAIFCHGSLLTVAELAAGLFDVFCH
jgi:hypothetical protein